MPTQLQHVKIYPGEYYSSNSPIVISTLLGSCVAACLYDPINKVVGMNHIMISREAYLVREAVCYPDDGKDGLCAMGLLVHDMISKGAVLKNMRAKVFGGASLFRPYDECTIEYCVGEVNIKFVMNYLEASSIPVVSKSIGGTSGRVIRFYSHNYSVRLRNIKKISNPLLIEKDNKAMYRLKKKRRKT